MPTKVTPTKFHYVLEMPFKRYFAIDAFLNQRWPEAVVGGGTNLITNISDIHLHCSKRTANSAILAIKLKFGPRSIKARGYTEEEWNNDKAY